MMQLNRKISSVLLTTVFALALLPLPTLVAQDSAEDETAEEIPMGVNPDALSVSLLRDNNGNGIIDLAAFGDSITRGVGDFIAAGQEIFDTNGAPAGEAGYPLRIETLVSVPVANRGNPGERIRNAGLLRFATTIPSLRPDVVIISGGSNDALDTANPNEIFRSYQTMVNIARAVGIEPVVATIPPVCCDTQTIAPVLRGYNGQIRKLSTINDIALAEVYHAFENTCFLDQCALLNIPEGLHPNIEGYDIMGEAVIAALFNIDLFAADGPANLELALGLPAGSVMTVPDFIPVPSVPTEVAE